MKKFLSIIILILFINTNSYSINNIDNIEEYIKDYEGKTITIAFDSFSGMEYFDYFGQDKGYLIDIIQLLKEKTGINFQLVPDLSWNEAFEGFKSGKYEVLFGANITPERLEYMVFTDAIEKYPYAVLTDKTSNLMSIGDLDGKKVGFIEGDMVIDEFPDLYDRITFETTLYPDQIKAIDALKRGEISSFITSGGTMIHKLVSDYELKSIAQLMSITSDLTLSTLSENYKLRDIIEYVLLENSAQVYSYIDEAKMIFNRSVLGLTMEEVEFLESDKYVVVGAVNNYLPFEYFENGEFRGIFGKLISELSNIIGMKVQIIEGDFDDLYKQALDGHIHILNIARTTEREEHFLFSEPYSLERDQIYGKRDADYIQDIYGLSEYKVAVIEGFWHEEYLKKNLDNPNIIITKSIEESMYLVSKGKADYFIENPTVVEFYTDSLGYKNISKKGETSADSLLYIGIPKDEKILLSIINKTMKFINYDTIKASGMENLPDIPNKKMIYLIVALVLLVFLLIFAIFLVIKKNTEIITSRSNLELYRQKEKMAFIDGLTNLNNRMYFNNKENIWETELNNLIMAQIDLNRLKNINDTYGHHIGDKVIVKFSQILKESFEKCEIIRMGGDEFLVICNSSDIENLSFNIEKLRFKSEQSIIDEIVGIEFSMGITFGKDFNSLNDMYIEADRLMYEEKNLTKEQSILRSVIK
jgi:diguanylate cyclase (GGDEF)-like protein